MQEALEGGTGSERDEEGGAEPGDMAGLQMDETVPIEVDMLLLVEDEEEEEVEEEAEPVLETAGGVNCPLLSEPVLSLVGEDFFFTGRAFVLLLPLCCCWRHFARRFLNHT